MRIAVDNQVFSVKFFYKPCVRDTKRFDPDGSEFVFSVEYPGEDTFCTIDQLSIKDEKVVGATQVAEGAAYLNPVDAYHKPFGRKKAFERAVHAIEDRAVRTALWKSFLATHRIPNKRTGSSIIG